MTATPPPGPGVDARGVPVTDPTLNVLALVNAANQRQDDLRLAEQRRVDDMLAFRLRTDEKIMNLQMIRQDDLRNEEMKHVQRVMDLTSTYEELLRNRERDRLDAIRAVDVGAVAEAARVAAAQATVLANQLVTTAEASRTQVNTVAQATATALANALEPLKAAIEDLRKTQFTQQGEKAAQTENKDTNQWATGIVIAVTLALGSLVATIIMFIILHK